MKTKKYLVTNGGEGSICISGRQRLEIPGKCVNLEISLPDLTAKTTISRLKQRYPLLQFKEVEGEPEVAAPAAKTSRRAAARQSAPESTPENNSEQTPEEGNGN